eukprot:TRINITY_DN20519_c0_g1_i1.p1 TRINITY_DN20519_c0_g1~~TRINITY_DN20519_c0_g1_i1.p1  ORF type:complete len:590 (+),score=52.47 TRINITY_DN20519_c0_g1_i1:54-1823(+)
MALIRSMVSIVSAVAANAITQPHIIHIVADDLGWNDVSMHGSDQIPTPTLDRLAAEGVRLDQFYVNPVCSPTRSALVSGRQTIHTSIYEPLAHHLKDGLNASCNQPGEKPCRHLAETMKSLGYKTAMVGKWHVGMYNWSWTPQANGFDFFTGYYNGAEHYYTHIASTGFYDMQINNEVDWGARGKYSTEIFTERAIKVIQNHAKHHSGVPLYMYLTFQAMHNPLEAPSFWIDKFASISDKMRRTVAAMVACLDSGIENVTKALEDAGMAANTTLIFHTDNGGPANGYNGNMASNMPLRGRKESVWEGGVRGVALIHGAGLKKRGYINHQLIHVTDLYFSLPTLASRGLESDEEDKDLRLRLAAWMADQPPFLPGDGMDVWDAIASNSTSRRTEVIHITKPGNNVTGALRVGEWKLVVGSDQTGGAEWYLTPGQSFKDHFTVKCGQPPSFSEGIAPFQGEPGSTVEKPRAGCNPLKGYCLFNIAEDPCEHIDRSSQEPEVLKSMLQRLKTYQSHSIELTWDMEEDRCLPQNLHGKYKGAERPCVGSPPELPPSPIRAPAYLDPSQPGNPASAAQNLSSGSVQTPETEVVV